MRNLTDARGIKLKGLLFLLLGLASVALLMMLHPDAITALLLMIAIWSFSRFYYFAFYVIEKYVDARFRFSGLWSFAWYLITGRADSSATSGSARADATTKEAPPS